MKKYLCNKIINFGAGDPVNGWINLDSSPFFLLPKTIHKLFDYFNISTRSKKYIKYDYTYFKFTEFSKLPFDSESIDVIYSSHVLEHLSYKENQNFISEAHRILKNKGILRIIVPDLEKKIKFSNGMFSLENELLTLPQELKLNKLRAILEAAHGFPSFHKTLFVSKYLEDLFSDKWILHFNLSYLESKISKKVLKRVEQVSRTKNALVFELIKK